jgi:hypothetical protein
MSAFFFAAVTVIVCSHLTLASPQAPLDTRLSLDLNAQLPLARHETVLIANHVADHVGAPLGFEEAQPPVAGATERRVLPFDGFTARQAFDQLTLLDPRYRWQEMDGVAVFRPLGSWNDPEDLLNRRIDPVDWTQVSARTALDALTDLLQSRPAHNALVPSGHTFEVHFPGGRVIDLLNTIVRTHGALRWRTQQDPQSPSRLLVTLSDMHGGGAAVTWTR